MKKKREGGGVVGLDKKEIVYKSNGDSSSKQEESVPLILNG